MTDQREITSTRIGGLLIGTAVVVVLAAMFAGVTMAADVTTAERSIEHTELAPGESTNVTVEVELTEAGDPAIFEEFDPAFENVETDTATPLPTIAEARDANDELVAIWNDTQSARIQYEVTVPENATKGDTFNITGVADSEDGEIVIGGDTQIDVVGEDFDVSIVETNDSVEQGNVLETTAEIENVGNYTGTQDIEFHFDEDHVDTEENLTLESGGTETVTFTADTTDVEPGDREVAVSSDDDAATGTITVTPPPEEASFDVAITDTNEPVEAGEELEVTAEIENTGDLEGTQNIEFLLNGSEVGVEEDLTLDGNESQTVTVTVATTDIEPGEHDVTVRSDDDSATTTVEVTSPPEEASFDVALTDTNGPVEAGAELEVTAEIENTGDLEGTQSVELLFDGSEVGAEEDLTLDGGESTTVAFAIDTTDVEPGEHDVTVRSADDSDTATVEVTAPPEEAFFDVALTETNGPVEAGEELEVTAEITNTGDLEETQNVEFLFDDAVEAVEENVTLDGGDSETITFTYTTSDVAPNDYDVDVQSDDATASGTVTVTAPPEDAFFNVSDFDAPTEVELGGKYNVSATITNVGDISGTQTVGYVSEVLVCGPLATDLTLNASESETVSVTCQVEADAEPGSYDLYIESENDSAGASILVGNAGSFDVTISDTNDPVETGEDLEITAEIANTGDLEETQNVEFLFNGSVEAVEENVTLAGGSNTTLTFTHDTSGIEPDEYEVDVQSDDDAANRTVTVTDAEPDPDPDPEPPTQPDPPEEAFFDVEITDTNELVKKGERVLVNATVENTGDETGEQDIEFLFDGEVKTVEEDVTIAGGETITLTITADPTVETGKYEVAVRSDDDTEQAKITVPEKEGTDDGTDETESDTEEEKSDGETDDEMADNDETTDVIDDSADDSTPGFGIPAVITGLVLALLLGLCRDVN